LAAQPSDDVTVPFAVDNVAEGSVTASLVFTNADWDQPQDVTITGVEDEVDDGDVAYNVTMGPSTSADANFDGLTAANVPVTNTNNDTRGILVNPSTGLLTTEAG